MYIVLPSLVVGQLEATIREAEANQRAVVDHRTRYMSGLTDLRLPAPSIPRPSPRAIDDAAHPAANKTSRTFQEVPLPPPFALFQGDPSAWRPTPSRTFGGAISSGGSVRVTSQPSAPSPAAFYPPAVGTKIEVAFPAVAASDHAVVDAPSPAALGLTQLPVDESTPTPFGYVLHADWEQGPRMGGVRFVVTIERSDRRPLHCAESEVCEEETCRRQGARRRRR